jgi:tetratricopeptide (TPR) repeat protein
MNQAHESHTKSISRPVLLRMNHESLVPMRHAPSASRPLRSSRLAPLHAVLLLALALLVGCPRGGETTPEELTIEDLRRAAAGRPNDPRAAFELAVGELLRFDGDPSRARAAIERAIALDDRAPAPQLLSALEAHQHGDFDRALDGFLGTLERDTTDGTFAELAAAGVEELAELAPRFAERVPARLSPVLARLPLPARHTATDVLTELAYRAGAVGRVRELASASGCATDWRVIGPFGPRDLLGFDTRFPAEAAGALADTYDLGPGRGEQPTRTHEARGCAVHLGGGAIGAGGVTYAETFVEIAQGGPQTLRLETPNAVEVRIDGERVIRLDHRRETMRRVTYHPIELSAGRHEIEVKVATRHPNPILAISIAPGRRDAALPDGDDPWSTYVAASTLFSRGAVVDARERLRPAGAAAQEGSATMRILQSAVALADPMVTDDMRRDRARDYLRAAGNKDAEAWFPVFQRARLEAAEGRDQEAIAILREASTRWPAVLPFKLTLLELLLGRGWDDQADALVASAREAVPGACSPIRGALVLAQRRDRVDLVDRHVEELLACDARAGERYQILVAGRRWDDAERELARLIALEPVQSRDRFLPSRLDLAESRADRDAVMRVLEEMRARSPRSPTSWLSLADRALAEGDRTRALEVLSAAIAQEPTDMADLRRVRTALGGAFELEAFRVRGEEAISAYREANASYDQPQVLVFDYSAIRVFEDMSSLQLVHQIYEARSDEAIDELGEFEPPGGAYVLTLQTIKPDGARLEPELIEGKDTISLPSLAVGDLVEMEYVRVLDPPAGLPNGVLGDRFYFASYEVPFFRSEQVLITPPGVEVTVDPRGPAPETRQSAGPDGTIVRRWRVDRSVPLVPEPASVSAREYLPSINWSVNASWSSFLDGLRDVLADRDVIDPAAVRLARQVAGEGDDRTRAERLYRWLLDETENNDDVFGEAPVMVAQRTGNRVRMLHYLLGLVGIRSDLLVARGLGNDQTRSEVADEETYTNLVLRLGAATGGTAEGGGEGAVYLQPTARGVPFGYLNPALRGQDALVLTTSSEGGVQRVELPASLGPADSVLSDSRRVEITARVARDGGAEVEIVETFRGVEAIGWRNDLESIPDAVLEQRFEEAYVGRVLSGARLESLRITGRDEPNEPFVLRYVARVPALARRQGGALVLSGLFPTALGPRFARLDERTTAQVVGPPIHLDVVLRVTTEDGAPSVRLPPVSLEHGGAKLTTSSREEGGFLVVERHLEVPMMRVSARDYPAFAAFCRAVDEAEQREIPLR